MNGSPIRLPQTVRVVVALLVTALAACAAPASSPDASAPVPSSTPSLPAPASPIASPASVAWRWEAALGPTIEVGPDGNVFAVGPGASCDVAVHALGVDGIERPGAWPYCLAGARYAEFLVVDGEGNAYVAGAERIVGLAPDGTPGPGWPAALGPLVGTLRTGVVVLTPNPSGAAELRAYDPDGSLLPGWPVTIAGSIIEPAIVGPDDAVAVLYRDTSTGHRSVTMIERDGSTRRGWPVAVPNDMDGSSVAIDLVTTDGRVVLRSHEPWPVSPTIAAMGGLRAQVATIAPDGTIPDGWPVRFEQPLSPVVEAPGGRLVAVLGDVQYGPDPTNREPVGPYTVVSLEPNGAASPGWPARLPDGITPQPAEVTPGPVVPWALPPVAGTDGSVVVITRGAGSEGLAWSSEGLAWFDGDGSLATSFQLQGATTLSSGVPAAPGGPATLPVLIGERAFVAIGIKTAGALAAGDGQPGSDTPGVDRPIPALTVDTSGGSRDGVLAVERDGVVAGWPVLLPRSTYVVRMLIATDGTLVVSGSTDAGAGVVAAIDPTATGSE